MNGPEKANWKELRQAFSKTSHYHPYNIDVDEKLKGIAESIGRGELKASETALLKLVERDRFMRFESLAMLMMLYDRMEQPEKSKKYGKLVESILGVLAYPKAGVGFENAIEVLYVEEEYFVTSEMPVKNQALSIKDGHRYDVFTIKATKAGPERRVYFNIDLLGNAKPIIDGEK